MTYSDFARNPPVLYGQMILNNKSKIGVFKATWHHFTNSLIFQYYSPKGNKGTGGFTLKRAYDLFQGGNLAINPDHGNPSNYL